MTETDLVERLVNHRILGAAPRPELEWLAEEGHRAQWEESAGVSRMSLFAWDFARIPVVAGFAYAAYLLDLDTAWQWMKRAALALQPAFGSFAELGERYIEGLAHWCGDPEHEQVHDARAAREALL